jgi:hypothetical protein
VRSIADVVEIKKGEDMKSKETKPGIVFCHGLWADGSCFNKVIPTLQVQSPVAAFSAAPLTKSDLTNLGNT